MSGLVKLRGGKLFLDGEPLLSNCTYLMPGDCAEIRSGRPYLKHRVRQTLPGFVESINDDGYTVVRFPTLGESCPFRVEAVVAAATAGDLIVMNFDTSGGAHLARRFPSEQYVAAILPAYQQTTRALSDDAWKKPAEETAGYYTQAGVADETGLNTFTVDPDGSADLDDAISVDVEERTIYIHIVDIAGTPTLDEYRMRQYCQTLYLANELTEDLLGDVAAVSLLLGQERAVITTRVRFTESGLVDSYDIYRSRIVSKRRLTYEEFGAMLETDNTEAVWLIALLHARNRDVTYDINLPSIRIRVSSDGNEVDITRENTMDPAHCVVSMLMVLCNMVVSRHLRERGVTIPNRLHKRLAGVNMSRLPVSSGEPAVDSFVMVKRFGRACYAIDERGHFGLGLTEYAHFTSPMRRYADVMMHRLLAGWTIEHSVLESEVEWINWRAEFNKSLQRQYTAWKVATVIASRLADGIEDVDVWITGLSAAGVLWYMPEYSLNGFCHVSQLLPSQRWVYEVGGGGVEATLVGAGPRESFVQMRQRPYRAIISRVDRMMGSIAVRLVCS
jgi:exoribonuclease R